MHELPWITIFWSRVRWFANDFHEWLKLLFTVTNVLFYFLHAILCFETPFHYKQSSITHFAIDAKDSLFSNYHCDVITVDLWCHANARHWHCEVILVDSSCTRKLAQRRSSLVNNNREDPFLTIRYSRLSVQEIKNYAWVSVNNDILVMSGSIRQLI